MRRSTRSVTAGRAGLAISSSRTVRPMALARIAERSAGCHGCVWNEEEQHATPPDGNSVLQVSRLASVPTPVERLARVSTKRSLTALHSEAITEYIAESRSRPSSPGAHDIDQLRNTPSNVDPTASIARRDRTLRASVLRSTRATRRVSKA